MKTFIKLAWRNIWRNKRRTFITVTSIFIAVFLALIMRSFQLGSYDNMINNVVQSFTGYIQIHENGYWDDKTINNTMELNDSLVLALEKAKNVSAAVPRLESFALASSGVQSKGALVVGIDPVKENDLTHLDKKIIKYRLTDSVLESLIQEGMNKEFVETIKQNNKRSFTSKEKMVTGLTKLLGNDNMRLWVDKVTKHASIQGKYLKDDDHAVMIGDRLARFLNLNVGDTLVLIGQGYHGISAFGKYAICGLIKMPNPELDNKMIYMPLKECQNMYSAYGRVSSVSLNLNKPNKLETSIASVKSIVNEEQYEVMSWKEMLTELVQQIESDNYSGLIMLYILYIVIGFGVFGTVLMMTAERQKEFGVMVAVGMKKLKLVVMVFLELLMLAILGIFSGIVLSLPIIRYFTVNPVELSGEMAKMMENYGMEPVMPFAWQLDFFVNQGITVAIIVLIAFIYPLFKISKLNVMKSIRG